MKNIRQQIIFVMLITGIAFSACDSGNNAMSESSEPPSTPIGFSLKVEDGEVILTWSPNNGANLSHYNIFQGLDRKELEKIAEVQSGSETFKLTGLEAGKMYYFAISAENKDGQQSNRTNEIGTVIGGSVRYANTWIKQFGSPSMDGFDAIGLTQSPDGTLWVVSYMNDEFEGISGPIIARLNSDNGSMLSIERLDFEDVNIRPSDIILAEDGGYLVTGWLQDALPGETRTGVSDTFVAKFDESGSYEWGKQIGIKSKWTEGQAIASSPTGDYYVTGTLSRGAALPGQTSSEGGRDIFLIKYNSEGEIVWIRQFGNGSDRLWSHGISVINDEIVIMGTLTDTHAPIPGSNSGGNAFVRRYNNSGDHIGTVQFDVPIGTNEGAGMVMDKTDVVWAFGSANDPFSYGGNGNRDFILLKINPLTGESDANAQFGTPETEWGQGITIGVNGEIFVGGSSNGSFEGQTNAGEYDIVISRLDLP